MKTLLASILAVAACTNGDSKSDSPPPMAASDVQFDNTTSGLASKNVQDALDDVIAMAQEQEDHTTNSVVVCRFVSANWAIPPTSPTYIQPHAFTASECGGTLPDMSYIGSISRMHVCNSISGVSVMSAGEPDGPGVQLNTYGNCSGPAEIVAVFVKLR